MKSDDVHIRPIPGKSKSDLDREIKDIKKQVDKELSIWNKPSVDDRVANSRK